MSIIKRIGAIWKSEKKQPQTEAINPFEESGLGDIITIDLEQYVVSGRTEYFDRGFAPHRFAYYLQNGREISCLLVEKGRTYDCFLCQFVEGALDDPNDVPSILEVDGDVTFELEYQRNDLVKTSGNTDFRSGDELLFWRYFSKSGPYFFLQWQDGKFVAMEGASVSPGEIEFLKSSV